MVTSKVSEADVPRLQADVSPSSLRYVCLDFETNGFPEKDCKHDTYFKVMMMNN